MLFISADCRAQARRDELDAASTMMRTTSCNFSLRAEAVLRLGSIGEKHVSVLMDVPEDVAVDINRAAHAPYSGTSTDVVQAVDVEGDDQVSSPAPVDAVLEGAELGAATEMTEDEAATAIAMKDLDQFAARFSAAVAEAGFVGDESSSTILPDKQQTADFSKYPLGQLPDQNDSDVPQDVLSGFRS
jgi:hypothetical protein